MNRRCFIASMAAFAATMTTAANAAILFTEDKYAKAIRLVDDVEAATLEYRNNKNDATMRVVNEKADLLFGHFNENFDFTVTAEQKNVVERLFMERQHMFRETPQSIFEAAFTISCTKYLISTLKSPLSVAQMQNFYAYAAKAKPFIF